MNNDKIKPSQFMFLITGFLSGSILLLSFTARLSKQDTWFNILLSFLVIIPFIASYVYIGKRFPNKNIIEIHDIVYGKALGKVISILYIFYFLSLLSFNLADVSNFFVSFILPETPQVVLLVLFALCCAYAVKKGIQAVAGISSILVILVVSVVIITLLLLIGKMDFHNFLPVLELPIPKLIQSTSTTSMVSFGEVVVFLMVIPYVNDTKKLFTYALKGTGIAGLIFFLIVVRDTAVLGSSSVLFTQNPMQTVRFINIGEFLNRVELFIFLNNANTMFIKVSVLYFVTVKSLSQILNLKTLGPLIIPIGTIAIIYALNRFPSAISHSVWGEKFSAAFEFPFTVVFPLLTLIIVKIRKLSKNNPKLENSQA